MSKQQRALATVGFILAVGLAFYILYYSNRLVQDRTRPRVAVAVNSLAVAAAPVFIAADPTTGDLRRNLDYDEVPFPAGRLALDALKAGDVDAATVAETPIVLASIDRPDLRVVATIAKSKLRIVARKSAGITSLESLNGKRIAMLSGSSSEYFLSRGLSAAKLTPANITTVNMQPPDMVAALRRGDVDAIAIWEPHAQRAIDALGTDALVFDDRSDPLYTEFFNVVTTASILRDRQKRAALATLLISLSRASDKVYKDAGSRSVVASRVGIGVRELNEFWSRFTFSTGLNAEPLLHTMVDVEVWAAAGNHRAPRTADELRELIDNSLFERP